MELKKARAILDVLNRNKKKICDLRLENDEMQNSLKDEGFYRILLSPSSFFELDLRVSSTLEGYAFVPTLAGYPFEKSDLLELRDWIDEVIPFMEGADKPLEEECDG